MRGRILLYAFPVLVLTVLLSTREFQSSTQAQTAIGKAEIAWTAYGGRADSSRSHGAFSSRSVSSR